MALHYSKEKAKIGFGKQKTEKFVGRARRYDTMSLDVVSEEIGHHCDRSQKIVRDVLEAIPDGIVNWIQSGHGVDLGFIRLKPSISTISSEDEDKVKIRKKHFVVSFSKEMKSILAGLSISLDSEEEETESIDNGELIIDNGSSDDGSSSSGEGDDDPSSSSSDNGGGQQQGSGDNGGANEGD